MNNASCPSCIKKYNQQEKDLKKLSEDYEKISKEEFIKRQNQLSESQIDNPLEICSLFQDYSIDIVDNKLLINYKSSCDICKWEFNFKNEFEIKI